MALGGSLKWFWDDFGNFWVIWSRQDMSEDPGDIFKANNRPLIDEDCRFFLFLNLIYLGLNLIFRFFLDNFPTARFFCPIAIMFLFCHFKLFSTFAAFWPCLPWTQNTKKENWNFFEILRNYGEYGRRLSGVSSWNRLFWRNYWEMSWGLLDLLTRPVLSRFLPLRPQ